MVLFQWFPKFHSRYNNISHEISWLTGKSDDATSFSLLVEFFRKSTNRYLYSLSADASPCICLESRIVRESFTDGGGPTDFFRTSAAMFQEKTSFSSQRRGQRGLSLPRYIRRYLKIELTFINIISRGQLSTCISRRASASRFQRRGLNTE